MRFLEVAESNPTKVCKKEIRSSVDDLEMSAHQEPRVWISFSGGGGFARPIRRAISGEPVEHVPQGRLWPPPASSDAPGTPPAQNVNRMSTEGPGADQARLDPPIPLMVR